ncbi:2Fe-2S iron-sulfur cluster-binding protein [Pseudoduganella sp. UC29_106]|uniref:2Fe-2S iron-sulfur cluster-binding protein n=1 Tax=Pseudoduganella sp. UC29_106 TaxID=3374553 RepID=UPI003757A656
MHQVTFNFADGASRSFDVAPGEPILNAAIAAEIPVLYQCQSGSCSTCVAKLSDGDAQTRAGASSTLLSSEVSDGLRLLCVCEAKTDCSFDLAYTSEAGAERPPASQCLRRLGRAGRQQCRAPET